MGGGAKMKPTTRRRVPTLLLAAAGALILWGCGLNVTNERPTYEELDPLEQSAVQTVLKELRRLDTQFRNRTPYDISEVIDRDRIHVSFEGIIFSGNLGDDTIHVAIWENLTPGQQALVAGWFEASPTQARAIYRKFFYQFMGVVQGVKQFMYKVHTPQWIFKHRTLWSIERDSIRTALSHYAAEGRKGEIWPFLTSACGPVKRQFGPTYSNKFSKPYLQQHFTEIFNPEHPTGYMYFICRWIDDGKLGYEGLNGELDWLINLPE